MNTTIIYQDVEFNVEYDYQPYEKMVRYYSDGTGYPGCEESLAVTLIEYEGRDMTEYFYDFMEEIEELVWEGRQSYFDYGT